MNEQDFFRQQEEAVEHMREMNARANPSMPPIPPFVRVPRQHSAPNSPQELPERKPAISLPQSDHNPIDEKKQSSFFEGLNLPFFDHLSKEGDLALIAGLLLILISEKADKKLLFALIYILM